MILHNGKQAADAPLLPLPVQSMNNLDMLTSREQLMQDAICIVESHFPNENVEDVIRQLCDAVCKNFPTPLPVQSMNNTATDTENQAS